MKTLIIVVAVILTISSCKKGEDDPTLSLRSRTNRLEGNWVVKKMNAYIDMCTGNKKEYWFQSLLDAEIIDGYRFSRADFSNYGCWVMYRNPLCKINFSKDGATTCNINADGFSSSSQGTWEWDNDIGKTKEYLRFSDLNLIFNDLILDASENLSCASLQIGIEEFQGINVFKVQKLSNKEIVLFTSSLKNIQENSGYDNAKIQVSLILTKSD